MDLRRHWYSEAALMFGLDLPVDNNPWDGNSDSGVQFKKNNNMGKVCLSLKHLTGTLQKWLTQWSIKFSQCRYQCLLCEFPLCAQIASFDKNIKIHVIVQCFEWSPLGVSIVINTFHHPLRSHPLMPVYLITIAPNKKCIPWAWCFTKQINNNSLTMRRCAKQKHWESHRGYEEIYGNAYLNLMKL